MQLQNIKVQRLYLQVAQQLQELIATEDFGPGSRLPSERDLAEQFGVSRPTIREAIIALEIARQVEVRTGSGVYVLDSNTPVTLSDAFSDDKGPGPFKILQARMLIEGETCALAASRITDAQLARLQELLDEMAEENRKEDITETADEKFHCLIAEAAGNSALSATVKWLWKLRNDAGISSHFQGQVRERGKRPIVADHAAILDALRSRDAQASRDAMCRHLQSVTDHLMEVM
jgi:GntR family transcriptional repressor for pyruvate dehydrogenase complex